VRSSAVGVSWRATAVIASLAWMPALSAGPPGWTPSTSTPAPTIVETTTPEVRAAGLRDLAGGDELPGHALDRVPGIANPMPGACAPPSSASVAASVGIPITAPSRSTSAPPELPGLIAALVWMTDGSTTPLPSRTVRPTAETIVGDARPQPERVADREREVADLDLGRVGECRRARLRVAQPDHGEVVLGVGAHERGALLRAARKRDLELLRVADDVSVRDDVAVSVEDDAGPSPAGVWIWTTEGEIR
jgi:hypothetical protein